MGARPIVNIPTPTWSCQLNGTGTDVIGGNTLTWAGTTRYDPLGGGNYGAFMDGGEYLKSTSPILSGRTFTIEFKLRFDAASIKTSTCILAQHTALDAGRLYFQYELGAAQRLQVLQGGAVRARCPFVPVVGKPHHIVLRFNVGVVDIFFEGQKLTKDVNTTFDTNVAAVQTVISRLLASGAATDFYGLFEYARVWNGTAFTDAQAAELYVRSKAPVQNPAMLKLVSGGTIPSNRANELFNTHNFSRDLSVNNVAITRYGGAKITRDGLLCDGASGGASIADKIGTGDVTIYITLYPKTLGALGGYGRILSNGSFLLWHNSSNLQVTSDGVVARVISTVSLLKPIRLCVLRKSNGLTTAYINGNLALAEIVAGAPTAATTALFIGNQSDGLRAYDGLLPDLRINSGIDTEAQRVADNARYGFK